MEKMWAGRFEKALNEKADDFNSSIRFDYKMYASSKLLYIGEYQEGGYTSSSLKLMFKNQKSTYYAFKSDTFYLTKHKADLVKTVVAWARYYAWKRLNKFKHLYTDDLNIKSFKKVLGWVLSHVFYVRYRQKQKVFLQMH